ncbi:hypothetical protein SAMD00019534_113010 [Acytostelium subglobosum LB1]|uniref:hypothetical protein n=1 Tax=Acytostelium subglobosum LB1 TaxID=1410327 RepID=UPI000644D29C|nr:hypothetical protein SAMD00019534_113010 [Acytostelium subglobosum LB1]GAM28125.1 hypothetical protein SAMD00019534_113010 [Acytostelium subglobosum LB1]|eukprot:XP_012749084.1 hypothetical protein SAMD00019534_113010 [Acytostelium subglobosum LB1]
MSAFLKRKALEDDLDESMIALNIKGAKATKLFEGSDDEDDEQDEPDQQWDDSESEDESDAPSPKRLNSKKTNNTKQKTTTAPKILKKVTDKIITEDIYKKTYANKRTTSTQ